MLHNRILQGADKGETCVWPAIRINQFDGDRPKLIGILGVGPRNRATRIATNLGDHEFERVGPVLGLIFSAQRFGRALHLAHHLKGIFACRTGQHGKIAGDLTLFRRIEKAPADVTFDKERDLAGQQHKRHREHGVTRLDDKPHEGAEQRLFEPVKTAVHSARGPVIPVFFRGMGNRVGQMVRQDQETLDQTGRQNHDHRERNVRNQITKTAPDNHQTKEGDNGRERRGKDRTEHALGGAFGGNGGVFAHVPHAEIGMFAHHNGIIDNNAQGDDQREQRDHVDRDPDRIHQRNRGQHRHRDTKGDPERSARVQKQKQQTNHEHQPRQTIVEQDIQTPLDQFSAAIGQRD